MPDLREAFRKAAGQNPRSSVTREIFSSDQRIRQEKAEEIRRRELEILGRKFYWIGKGWYELNDYYSLEYRKSRGYEELKRQWQELQGQLSRLSNEEGTQVFDELAGGMLLSEDKLGWLHRRIAIGLGLKNPLEDLSGFLRGVRFSPASKIFIEAIIDITGYTQEEATAFKDFVFKSDDFRGLVRLPQVFPVVARWFTEENISHTKP